jgi:hypothetical protein
MNRTNRFILSLFFLLGFTCINSRLLAQAFSYFEKNLAQNKSVFGFNLSQKFETNSLTSGFVLDFVNGHFISDEQKEDCIRNFKNESILAGEQFNLSLNYQRKLGGSNNYLNFEADQSFFYESNLHPDIFVLLFKGNKTYENKVANLNPLKIRSLQYINFKVGFQRITDNYTLKLNIGYVGGQRFLDLTTTQGGLFTQAEGRSIDLNLKLKSLDVNPADHSFLDFSGSGFMTDLVASYKLSNSIEIETGIKGYGSIKWNNNVTERIVDTMYHFDGAEISNVLDSFSIAIKNVEELKSSFINESQHLNYRTDLPYLIYIKYSQFIIPEILQLQLRYGSLKSDFSKSLFNSSVNLLLSSNKLVGLNLDAGGYGGWNLGAQFAICFSNKTSIHLYFNSISNLAKPSREFNLTGGMIYRRAI